MRVLPPPRVRAGRGGRAPWVAVHGSWLPRALFGRLIAACAYVRCCWATLALLAAYPRFDVVLLDQVAAPILLLRALSAAKAR